MCAQKVVNPGKIKELKLTIAMIDVQSGGCVGHVQFQDIEHMSVPEKKVRTEIGNQMKRVSSSGKERQPNETIGQIMSVNRETCRFSVVNSQKMVCPGRSQM